MADDRDSQSAGAFRSTPQIPANRCAGRRGARGADRRRARAVRDGRSRAARPATPLMTAAAEAAPPADVQVLAADERCGSDFMVDVFKSLDFDYICANPGIELPRPARVVHQLRRQRAARSSSRAARGVVRRDGARLLQGEGKPLAVMAHGTVGLQHASMALYNAWCDRVPVYMIIGNHGDAAMRRGAEWYHGVQDAAAMVRDYTKWDDTPWSLDALRRIGRARVQDRAHAADGAGRARARRRSAGGAGQQGGAARDSEAHDARAAAGRVGRRRGSRADARRSARTRCSSRTASRARRTA